MCARGERGEGAGVETCVCIAGRACTWPCSESRRSVSRRRRSLLLGGRSMPAPRACAWGWGWSCWGYWELWRLPPDTGAGPAGYWEEEGVGWWSWMDMARVGLPRVGVCSGGGPMPRSWYLGVLGRGVDGVLGLLLVSRSGLGTASDWVCL